MSAAQRRLDFAPGGQPIVGPLVVNFAGGTNSTAVLVGCHERGMLPGLIVFSDTGDEKPHTYAHIWRMQEWCDSVGFPAIQITRWERKRGANAGRFVTISEQCEERREMPSKAYGYAGCTTKWKSQPLDAYVRAWPPAAEWLASGRQLCRVIGFDADEPHRFGRDRDTQEWAFRYLLVEWGWGREECRAAIARAGLPQPGKSSCFHCPNSRPPEVLWLKRNEPGLFARAIRIEDRAIKTTVTGLGRGSFTWRDLGAAADGDAKALSRLPPRGARAVSADARGEYDPDDDDNDLPCGCFDG